ncbi:hypothetical protein PT974_10917 [Cladobotryum mycophilum]|uniref:Uncharacterized protein n=1 Tax=Cladobotryum mycophilum TaxID=491253 RepID=A0ABR0SBD3_9HYPO
MKLSLLAISLLASTGLTRTLGTFPDQPQQEWAEIPLDSPKNWVPGESLAKARVDGWIAGHDALTYDQWSSLVLEWCKEIPSTKSASVFSDTTTETGPTVRYWFGHCFNTTVTAGDFTRKDSVTTAFLASAYISVLLQLISYFLPGVVGRVWFNSMDELFTKVGASVLMANRPPDWVIESGRKTVMMISYQQLVTGIAIFIVGFVKHCTITQYHFYVVYLLGSISSIVHQSAIFLLTDELRKNTILHTSRAVVVIVLSIMLLAGQFLVCTVDYFRYSYGLSPHCAWTRISYDGVSVALLVIGTIMTIWGLLDAIYAIYPTWSVSVKTRKVSFCFVPILRFPSRWHSKPLRQSKKVRMEGGILRKTAIRVAWLVLMTPSFLLSVICFGFSEIWTSHALSVLRICTGLIWASKELVTTRQHTVENRMQGSENEWGFGQLLPLLLLVLPMLSAIEIYFGKL